jgi:hypothetical protein
MQGFVDSHVHVSVSDGTDRTGIEAFLALSEPVGLRKAFVMLDTSKDPDLKKEIYEAYLDFFSWDPYEKWNLYMAEALEKEISS